MSELPIGWITSKLVKLTEDISYGYTASSTQEKVGPHLLRITDIQNNHVSWGSVPFCVINEEQAKKYSLKENDLVFARTGATVGKSFLIKREIPESVFASYLIRVRCLQPELASFLAYYFRSPDYWLQITDFSAGIGQPNVNGSKLKELNIPLPPVAEQTRIAQKLDELLAQVDTLKARIDAIPALLKRFRQSVLASAVSGRLTTEWRAKNSSLASTCPPESATTVDSTWPEVSLSDVARSFSYGSSAKSKPNGDVPVLRMGNIQGGCIDWTDLVFSTDEAEIKKYVLHAGDILFNRTNSPELVGKTAIYKGDRPAIYAGYLIRVRCSEFLKPEFLNYCLNSPQGRHYCWQVKTDGVSQSNINAKKLAAFRFGLPEFEEQTEIVRRVEQLFAFADQLEAKVASAKTRIDHLTQSILAKAFRGELVPQDPNDEPASVLLERIKAQRAAAPKAKRGRKASV